MAFWCRFWSFGIFLRFGMFGPRKSGNRGRKQAQFVSKRRLAAKTV
jgi:hypothetical protein